MKTEKEIIELAYAYWLGISDPNCPPLFLIMGGPSVLGTLLWILGVPRPEDRLLATIIETGRKGIEQDCVQDPISRIVRDLDSRQEAQKKAASAVNN